MWSRRAHPPHAKDLIASSQTACRARAASPCISTHTHTRAHALFYHFGWRRLEILIRLRERTLKRRVASDVCSPETELSFSSASNLLPTAASEQKLTRNQRERYALNAQWICRGKKFSDGTENSWSYYMDFFNTGSNMSYEIVFSWG